MREPSVTGLRRVRRRVSSADVSVGAERGGVKDAFSARSLANSTCSSIVPL